MTVAVVTPAHNGGAFLQPAIESVLAQTLSPEEFVVVDDGSTDDTADIVSGYGDRVRVIRQAQQGVAAARNAGIFATRSRYVAFLDADDVWRPEKLARQRAALEADPGAALVHVGVVDVDADGAPGREHLDGASDNVAPDMLTFKRPVILGGGSGVMVPRARLDEVGPFDPRLSTSADWDLYYRLASAGRVLFLPEILLEYRIHANNMHRNVSVMEHDMLLAFDKALTSIPIRQRRYVKGRLHSVLAGSYFRSGNRAQWLRHQALAAAHAPSTLIRPATLPVRRLRSRT